MRCDGSLYLACDSRHHLMDRGVACGECGCSGVEEWESGGVEEWRSGGVEEWRSGGVEEWRSGGVEEWRSGGVESRAPKGPAAATSQCELQCHHLTTVLSAITTVSLQHTAPPSSSHSHI